MLNAPCPKRTEISGFPGAETFPFPAKNSAHLTKLEVVAVTTNATSSALKLTRSVLLLLRRLLAHLIMSRLVTRELKITSLENLQL
jgi:hypothetical protein